MPDHETDVEGQVMLPPQPLKAMKGRGAVTNLQGRYEVNGREAYDDGWQRDEDEDAPAGWKTHVTDEAAKTILSRNTSPDLPFSVSLNPYRAVSTVAFIALRGPRTAIWVCRPASTSRARSSPRSTRPSCCGANCPRRPTCPTRSRSASTRTPTSPASASASLPGACSKCCKSASTR